MTEATQQQQLDLRALLSEEGTFSIFVNFVTWSTCCTRWTSGMTDRPRAAPPSELAACSDGLLTATFAARRR